MPSLRSLTGVLRLTGLAVEGVIWLAVPQTRRPLTQGSRTTSPSGRDPQKDTHRLLVQHLPDLAVDNRPDNSTMETASRLLQQVPRLLDRACIPRGLSSLTLSQVLLDHRRPRAKLRQRTQCLCILAEWAISACLPSRVGRLHTKVALRYQYRLRRGYQPRPDRLDSVNPPGHSLCLRALPTIVQ